MNQHEHQHDQQPPWPTFFEPAPAPRAASAHTQPGAPAPFDPRGFQLAPAAPQPAQPGGDPRFHYAAPTQSHAIAAPFQPGAVAAPFPQQHGHAPAQAPALVIGPDGRTYAYATPSAFDMFDHAHNGQVPYAHAQVQAPGAAAAVAPAAEAASTRAAARRRLRWETIVPIGATIVVVATVAFVVMNFDAITGRDAAQLPAPAVVDGAGTNPAAVDEAAGEARAALDEAARLSRLGRYDQARARLDGLDEDKVEGLAELRAKINTSQRTNDELLELLALQRQNRSWVGSITTIAKLKALRPLTPDLVRMRTQAQRNVRAAKARTAGSRARTRARSQARAQARARSAASRTNTTRTRRMPPRVVSPPGATRRGGAAPRPPRPAASASLPPRPTIANPSRPPSGGGIMGAQPGSPMSGSGTARSQPTCHQHDGATMCS